MTHARMESNYNAPFHGRPLRSIVSRERMFPLVTQ
jgi:hypothetical protein